MRFSMHGKHEHTSYTDPGFWFGWDFNPEQSCVQNSATPTVLTVQLVYVSTPAFACLLCFFFSLKVWALQLWS